MSLHALHPARAAPAPPPRRPAWRALIWQALVLLLAGSLLAWLGHNTHAQMLARGMQTGWDFLSDPAGFDIAEQALAFDAGQSYARAFAVGLLNSLRVALCTIVVCTALGGGLGWSRFGGPPWLRAGARAYVEVFRNTPLLVQLFMCYMGLLHALPQLASPLPGGWVLSKAGLSLPWPVADTSAWHWSLPQVDAATGADVQGGALLSCEFLALWLSLSLYTAAYVAEVVRAGLASVPRAQWEAAQSLGLTQRQVLRRVVAPQAWRVIAPGLTNQYLNLIKNSSLAVAVGYPDLMSIANTSLNQTGRAVECMALVMAVYLGLALVTAALMAWLGRQPAQRLAAPEHTPA